jgi:mannose-1-phosphate guanylyltransferase
MRHAVILAGGSGTRLWPASRRATPKQFLALGSPDESLLAATARRLTGCRIAVVTAADQADMVRRALPNLDDGGVIAEPTGRNTAAALGLAAIHLLDADPDAVMGAVPADQHVTDEAGFARVVGQAFALAEKRDVIVTVGLVPTRPETGFGYLELGPAFEGGARRVARFVEKPDRATAERYLASGDYLWNGGMFFVRAARLLADIERLMPETWRGLAEIRAALATGNAGEVADRVYPTLPRISIDYGVMEKTTGVVTIPGDFGWNDVGSWSALADYRPADAAGNVIQGTVVTCDAADNIVVGDPDRAIAVVGVSGLVVVQAGDAVLVVPRDRAQDVRDAVAALEKAGLERFL